MDVTNDRACFVCGPENSTGLRAVFFSDPERLESSCSIAIPQRFQGWTEIVHGGIIASLLDEACIYAGRSLAAALVTAELAVRYKRPLKTGQEALIQGVVVEKKRKLLKVRATLKVEGEVYAEADAKVFLLDSHAG